MFPLIILGAGASHGYIDSSKFATLPAAWRPPLLNSLFDTSHKEWDDISRKFGPDLTQLVTSVHNNAEDYGGFEKYLDYVLEQAVKNPNRYRQLITLRYYIAELFRDITNKYYHPSNNFGNIIELIRDHCDNSACFVNFNYDLLLERTIPGLLKNSIDDYVSGPIKVIKIHGAFDWAFIVENEDKDFTLSSRDFFMNVAQDIMLGKSLPALSNTFSDIDVRFQGEYSMPAVVLPLTRNKSFICPPSHMDILDSQLAKADKILMIGWSGGDDHLIERMNPYLNRNKSIHIIGKDGEDANIIADRIRSKINRDQAPPFFVTSENDFTGSRKFIREFFST